MNNALIATLSTLAGAVTAHLIHARAIDTARQNIEWARSLQPAAPRHEVRVERHTITGQGPQTTPGTAEDRILLALQGAPASDNGYIHKDDIRRLSKIEGSTLENTLCRLKKEQRIHVRLGARGYYGIGPSTSPESTAVPRPDGDGEGA